jgi:hypothetical protein
LGEVTFSRFGIDLGTIPNLMLPTNGLMVVDLVGYIGTFSCIVEKEIEILIRSILTKYNKKLELDFKTMRNARHLYT